MIVSLKSVLVERHYNLFRSVSNFAIFAKILSSLDNHVSSADVSNCLPIVYKRLTEVSSISLRSVSTWMHE
jgi:hypothetical protein